MRALARTARQLGRFWQEQARLDLLWVGRDLKNVLLYYGSELLLNLAAVTATLLLAQRFDGIGAWSKLQVVFMLGYAMLATGIPGTLFSYNVLFISRRLGRGHLDHTLIQPRPVWMALLTEGFAPFSDSAVLIPGAGLMLWAGSRLSLQVTPGWLALLSLNLLASAGIVVAFMFLWGSLAFWAPRAAEEITSSSAKLLAQLKPFPLDGVAPLLLGGLLSFVPVGFVAWYPCRALLGLDRRPSHLAVTPLAAALLLGLAYFVFCKGMQRYVRTGSQRYLAWGHRR